MPEPDQLNYVRRRGPGEPLLLLHSLGGSLSITADRLIEDKLAIGDWSGQEVKSNAFLVSASAWTLGITARIIQPGETPDTILETLIKRLGLPAVRTATRQAMRMRTWTERWTSRTWPRWRSSRRGAI